MGHPEPTVAVLAPHISLTVTIEQGTNGQGDEVHIHPGGQGFWVARMLRHLGERPVLCGPVGGESGAVIRGLFSQWGMDISPVKMGVDSPVTIQDRRSGDRDLIAETGPPSLSRHEADDVYDKFFDHALSAGVCVIPGQPGEVLPQDAYRRLGHDMAKAEVLVVADLHGPELDSLLDGGPIDLLKVSDEDLESDGLLTDADDADCLEVMDALIARGAAAVVVSRERRPALARFSSKTFQVTMPELDPADHRGAGDSMTAGLAAGLRRAVGVEETLRLACAAGAANVTRHGLGSADAGLVEKLLERVDVTPLVSTP